MISFFITQRSSSLWQMQTVFAILSAFAWAPFRYLRPGAYRSKLILFLHLFIDFVTLSPFLFSLLFLPAMFAYVPTYLRVWITKSEALTLVPVERKAFYLAISLFIDVIVFTLTIIGLFEWSENNFPYLAAEPLSNDLVSSPTFACISFTDSLYWFLVTFSTVGYGDVVATNEITRIFVIVFIVLFLILLPEFITRTTTVLRLLGDIREISFNRTSYYQRDHIVLDGYITPRIGIQALTLLQPKFYFGEHLVSYVVVLSNREPCPELLHLRDFRRKGYTKLVILQGSLDNEGDVDRSKAFQAKTIYVLPNELSTISTPMEKDSLESFRGKSLRESVQESRQYCMQRDFDVIRRIWSVHKNVGRDVIVACILMHKANSILFDRSNLIENTTSNSGTFDEDASEQFLIDEAGCRCKRVNVMSMDSFEQRIGACSCLIPGYSTLILNLLLSGGCADKTYAEYEREASTSLVIDEMSWNNMKSQANKMTGEQASHSLLKEAFSVRNLLKQNYAPAEEYLISLRNGLFLIPFKSRVRLPLTRVRELAFDARVLVFAWVAREDHCIHSNFKHEDINWDPQSVIRHNDFLIVFGLSYQTGILSHSLYWQKLLETHSTHNLWRESIEATEPASKSDQQEATQSSSRTSKRNWKEKLQGDSLSNLSPKHRALIREGDHSHFFRKDQYLIETEKRRFASAQIKDVRGVTATKEDSLDAEDDDDNLEEQLPKQANQEGYIRDSTPSVEETRPVTRSLPTIKLEDHIIISTSSFHDTFVFFVRKLRSRDLQMASKPILLFAATPPNKFRWTEISGFNDIYYLQGRAFIVDDLKRAGFEQANCLILLTDARMAFENVDLPSLEIDRDNILAEKVATRLKKSLNCKTRIITHLSREESCPFVGGVEINSPFDFLRRDTFKKLRNASELKRHEMMRSLGSLFKVVWSPIFNSAYITGETWSPSCFVFFFFATETKGAWISNFLECLTDFAATKVGLNFTPIPEEANIVTYEDAVKYFLIKQQELVIGIFENFEVPSLRSDEFRGVVLFPSNDKLLTRKDYLYVLKYQA